MRTTIIIMSAIYLTIGIFACGIDEDLPDKVNETIDDAIDDVEGTRPKPTPTPIPERFIPENCDNPPKHISFNDGFKCIGSATRGGSTVCLLPYQFSWKPHIQVIDHHGNEFACNKYDDHFDEVYLVLKSGKQIDLKYAGCHNYVATSQGNIGRQHFRDESRKWSKIKKKVSQIVMMKDNKATCLEF